MYHLCLRTGYRTRSPTDLQHLCCKAINKFKKINVIQLNHVDDMTSKCSFQFTGIYIFRHLFSACKKIARHPPIYPWLHFQLYLVVVIVCNNAYILYIAVHTAIKCVPKHWQYKLSLVKTCNWKIGKQTTLVSCHELLVRNVHNTQYYPYRHFSVVPTPTFSYHIFW